MNRLIAGASTPRVKVGIRPIRTGPLIVPDASKSPVCKLQPLLV